MSDNEKGEKLLREAFQALEDGLWDDADEYFQQAIQEFGETHHKRIIALRSLQTIASNRGDLHKSLDWSLMLLEAQGELLGYSHADTSRTVQNICTMCVTLGKTEIAEEVRQLAKDASDKEKIERSAQVKELRSRDALRAEDEETEDTEDQGPPTVGEALSQISSSILSTGAVPALLLVFSIVGVIFIPLAVLSFTYSDTSLPPHLAKDSTFVTINGDSEVSITSGSRVSLSGADSRRDAALIVNGRDARELGELLLNPLTKSEYLLRAVPEGLIDSNGRIIFKTEAEEFAIIKQQEEVARAANEFYTREQRYPEEIDQLGDLSYENPFTLRKDSPLIQSVTIPAQANAKQYIDGLTAGARWEGEAAFYPGAINCGHISSEVNSNAPETLLIHACSGSGNLFRDREGRPYLLYVQKGRLYRSETSSTDPLTHAAKLRILIGAPSITAMQITLLQNRMLLFYGTLALGFLLLGIKLTNPVARWTTIFIAILFIAASMIGMFVG